MQSITSDSCFIWNSNWILMLERPLSHYWTSPLSYDELISLHHSQDVVQISDTPFDRYQFKRLREELMLTNSFEKEKNTFLCRQIFPSVGTWRSSQRVTYQSKKSKYEKIVKIWEFCSLSKQSFFNFSGNSRQDFLLNMSVQNCFIAVGIISVATSIQYIQWTLHKLTLLGMMKYSEHKKATTKKNVITSSAWHSPWSIHCNKTNRY